MTATNCADHVNCYSRNQIIFTVVGIFKNSTVGLITSVCRETSLPSSVLVLSFFFSSSDIAEALLVMGHTEVHNVGLLAVVNSFVYFGTIKAKPA